MNAEDPVVRSSRREAAAALLVWLSAMSYSVGYCYLYGYRDPADIRLISGVPEWVLYGVVAPWTVCTIAAALFAIFIDDADLGQELEDAEGDLLAGGKDDDE